jgi:hypothetical protein
MAAPDTAAAFTAKGALTRTGTFRVVSDVLVMIASALSGSASAAAWMVATSVLIAERSAVRVALRAPTVPLVRAPFALD